jgi:two-component system cell cycle response regulator DivK
VRQFDGGRGGGLEFSQSRTATGVRIDMKKIMIVEDNELNMKLFNDLLQAQGYGTVQSSDGKDILKLAHRNRPDLIIMDVQLPGVSGVELTRMLKADADLKHIPILAVTAFAMKGDQEKIMESGCDGYLSKPISIPVFLETIAKFLC